MNTILFNIKNRISLVMLVAFSLLMTSCDDKLAEPVYDFANEDFYSSTRKFEMGVVGVRAMFSTQKTYGWYWMVFDNDTDVSHISGPGIGSNNTARDLGHYYINSSNAWIEEAWGEYYQGISRANLLLENMNKVKVKDTDTDREKFSRLIAEVRIFRALAYFDLVRLFGDIPFIDKFESVASDFKYKRKSKAEIYEFICTEFEESIDDMPWYDEYSGGYNGNISKGAAQALLARIYLFRGGWSLDQTGEMVREANYRDYYTKANTYLDALISSGKHELNSSYEAVFKNLCELKLEPKENLYEIPFYSATGANAGSSIIGSYNGVLIPKESKFGRANAFIRTHKFFADTFEDNDTRKPVAIADWKMTMVDGKERVVDIPANQSYNWTPAKWRKDWYTGPIQDLNSTNINWVLIRYSDALLMKAEVMNELFGPTAETIAPLNQVRRRAFGNNISEVSSVDLNPSDFTKETLFEEIKAERARELCFEGLRRLDLVRWNLLEQAISTTAAQFKAAQEKGDMKKYAFTAGQYFVHNQHELYPIPFRDITESQKSLTQNPGY